jgi:hypothetical protein
MRVAASAITLGSLLSGAAADGPGQGVSKSTYSANTPLVGLEFNLKYEPCLEVLNR